MARHSRVLNSLALTELAKHVTSPSECDVLLVKRSRVMIATEYSFKVLVKENRAFLELLARTSTALSLAVVTYD